MSTLMSIFIIVLVVINVGGCLWLILWTMNMNTGESDSDSTGHVWDGDLKEYNNPLPKWWLNTFYLSIVFTVVYLVLYPGFGSFPGVLGWTQTGQYEEQVEATRERYASVYAAFTDIPLAELASNPDAVRLGRNTFMNNCASCHGSDGRGAKGFPNLADGEWLHGGAPEVIYTTVANGRTGVMAPMGAVVGDAGADQIIDYLLAAEDDTSEAVALGQQKFMTSGCIGCHGLDASGNQAIGAPNLRDSNYLHGGSRADLKESIMNGRVNQMPAQLELIGEDRARLVTAYVLSLSQ
jgi:cytochrome c oxidase cbb3-type subunit 3